MRHNRKLNKYERKEEQKRKIENALHGTGLYEYQNRSNGILNLPKVAADGKTKNVPPKGKFIGDNYFMSLVNSNELIYVREIQHLERTNMEEKLILDQPDIYKEEGKVEHVVSTKPQKLNEQTPAPKSKKKLITEDPMAGIEIING